jgi:hypothetical protein
MGAVHNVGRTCGYRLLTRRRRNSINFSLYLSQLSAEGFSKRSSLRNLLNVKVFLCLKVFPNPENSRAFLFCTPSSSKDTADRRVIKRTRDEMARFLKCTNIYRSRAQSWRGKMQSKFSFLHRHLPRLWSRSIRSYSRCWYKQILNITVQDKWQYMTHYSCLYVPNWWKRQI